MTCLPDNAAARRYTRRFIPAMLSYAIGLVLAIETVQHLHLPAPLLYLVALLPALPILATIFIVGLYLTEEQDEFQRNVFIQSILCGLGITLAVTTTWGFLELLAGIPHFQTYLVYPLFWFFAAVSTPFLKARYR